MTRRTHQLKVCCIVGFQVKARTETVDDHFKPDVGQLIHEAVKQCRVL